MAGTFFQSGNPQNYTIGGVRWFFDELIDESPINGPERFKGFVDMGNVVEAPATQEITEQEHFTSKSGTRRKDRTIVTEVDDTITFTLDEPDVNNVKLFFRGNDIVDVVENLAATITTEIQQLDNGEIRVLGDGFNASAIVVKDISGNTTYILDTDYEVVSVIGGYKGIRRKGNQVLTASTANATVAGAVSVNSDQVVVDAVTLGPAVVGDIFKNDTTGELMLVQAIAGTTPNFTYTVERGYASTLVVAIADDEVLVIQTVAGTAIGDNAFVSVDYTFTQRAHKEIKPTTQLERKGRALFFAVSDTGNEFIRVIPLCQIDSDGDFNYDDEDFTTLALKLTVLDNTTSQPLTPFGVIQHFGVGENL